MPVKEENVFRIEKNNARIVRWTCNVIPLDKISNVELGNKLELNINNEDMLTE